MSAALALAATDPAPPPRGDALAIPIDDGLLVCAADQLMRLNEAGAVAWALLDGRRTVAEVAATVAEEIGALGDTPRDVEVESMRRFVRDLVLAGFLEPPTSPRS